MITAPGMIGGLGINELLVFLGIAVLLFGASRIPVVARSLGKSIREFKAGAREAGGQTPKPAEHEPRNE